MATLAATFNAADKSAPGHYGPSQTALILLDFHSLVVYKAAGPKGPEALEVVAKMRTWAKSQGIQVIHGLVNINLTPFETCKDAERFTGQIIAALQSSSNAEEPAVLFEGGAGDDVTFMRRPGYISALKSPGLGEFLQKKGIKSLILTGLSTSGVVLRTALAATDEEYVVTVLSDGCADPVQDVHDFLVASIFPQRGYVTTATEFQEGFSKRSGRN